ncbi:MAG: type II secretion system F family protein [Marinobacter sp.]
MVNPSLIAAIAIAGIAVSWLVFIAPSLSLRARARARLRRQSLALDEPANESAFHDLVFWLVETRLLEGDFKELEPSLDATGLTAFDSRKRYLASCWLLPVAAGCVAFPLMDFIAACVVLFLAFFVPRKAIRAAGLTAEKEQNREAIELCQMTRMLVEAGLSPERSLKLISHQARELMPRLIRRIDRFNRVMESGADRTVALDELGKNRNLTVLRNYVSLMKQSGTLGSKVAGGLDQIVEEAQHEERSNLKEETNKIGARMTVIMMVFMLPSLFLLIGGPAVLAIMDAFQR